RAEGTRRHASSVGEPTGGGGFQGRAGREEAAVTWEHRGARGAAGLWAVRIVAALLGLIGLVLAIGGAWLAFIGGSPYYLLAGLGLCAAAFFLFKGRLLGVTIYAAVFVATLFWALWEVGLHGWALVPRVVGPLVLFFVVLALVPAISASRTARQLALGGLVGALALVIAGGIGVAMSARAPEPRPLPPAQLAMTEPSLWPVG